MWLYHRVMSPNHEDRMANSVDPDQTAPVAVGAVWSGSALFAQAYLSENLGWLVYFKPNWHSLRKPDSACGLFRGGDSFRIDLHKILLNMSVKLGPRKTMSHFQKPYLPNFLGAYSKFLFLRFFNFAFPV